MFVVRWLILVWYFNEFVFGYKNNDSNNLKSIDLASRLRLILQNKNHNQSFIRPKFSKRQISPNFLS